jgi:hypothetical protein
VKVFTPRTVGDRKSELRAVQIGGTWLYAEDAGAVADFLEKKSKLLVAVLEKSGVSRFSYIAAVGRNALALDDGDYELVRALLNYTCARGWSFKLLCKDEKEAIYASYVAKRNVAKTQSVVDQVMRSRKAGGVVRFKELAERQFGGTTGSYYWAKGIAEHLVYLGLLIANDRWSVRGT